MMTLKVKAVERLVKFNKEDADVYRYVMSPELYIALSQAKVIREAVLRSVVNQGRRNFSSLCPLCLYCL